MEKMITVKDFSVSCGVSDSIVYRHIRNLKKEIGNHIIKQYGKKWLDDTAQTLIRQRIKQNPIVVSDGAQEKRISELEEQNKTLQNHLIDLQKEYVGATNTIKEQTDRLHTLELEKLRIEGAAEQTKVERDRANEKIESLQKRRLTIRERLTGRLQSVDAE